MKTYFINEAFEKAVNDYFKSIDRPDGVLYNSFLVVVFRMLINIYGSLDIINPYKMKNEYAFDHNLMKYGYNIEDIQEFKRLLDGYLQTEKKNETVLKKETNIYFIEVQKKLIDMFNLKRINFSVTDDERKEFFDLLYTPGSSNVLRLSYNYLQADNIYEIANYYQDAIKQPVLNTNLVDKKDLLSFEAYKMFGKSIADVAKLDIDEVNHLNQEIYKQLDINDKAMNKEYLVEEKLKEIVKEQKAITTGNGYVDILLVMSVIVTTLMAVLIFTTLVF